MSPIGAVGTGLGTSSKLSMDKRTVSLAAAQPAPQAAPATASAPGLEAGVVLQGTYRIGERLAVGGMGGEYVASHERLRGRCAVKILQSELLRNEEAFARFWREALIMSGLQHPHIAQVLDFNVTEDGKPYLIMELLEGRLLQEIIDEGRPLPPVRVASIVR